MSLNQLYLKSLNSLEFNKIILILEDFAVSESAKQMCTELLPKINEQDVKLELLQTDDAKVLLAKRGSPSFGGLKNIILNLKRAKIGSALTMRELLDVANVLRVLRGLIDYKAQENKLVTFLDEYFSTITSNKYLEDKIFNSIISEEEMSDNASSELSDIRRKIKNNSSKIRDILHKIIHSQTYQKFLQEPIITFRGDRFVVPVKNEYKNEINGIVHDTSTSGATVFIEPMSVVETNNELKILAKKEQIEIERVLFALSNEVATYSDNIETSLNNAIIIDFIFAKAKFANSIKATMPNINSKGFIKLNKARHPLIEKESAVPIDVCLGDEYSALVITGPNTGGKTVSLKTIGLLTAMAASGLHIPVKEKSEICIFNNIYADIGDEQSIEQSLSTFSAHMTNIVKIVDVVDENCLVLFDELGAGTDPVEGAGLAISILDYIRGFGARVVATTHYSELKLYALETKGVQNASCEFNVNTLMPTFRLITGVPGRSNAFAIALRLGLNEHIIHKAKEIMSDKDLKFENVLEKLEDNRRVLEEQKDIAENERLKAELLLFETEKMKIELETKIRKENEKVISQARMIIENAKEQTDTIIFELEALKKVKDKENFDEKLRELKQKAKTTIKKLDDEANPVEKTKYSNYSLPRALKEGDLVKIISIDKTATVIIPVDDTGYVTVRAGIINTKVKLNDLFLVENNNINNIIEFTSNTSIKKGQSNTKNEIDIRGKTALEVEVDLEFFIDNAVLSGLSVISVIHGKGTGALRKAVGEMLKANKSVKSFRLGRYGEGETGVTIIELK